ncbi:SCO family protein [Aquimonas sp.]|jgi:protein SCO1/2|uniref:SCO family protein n=1 Tax=Aquimonas sp. TaxID=1872588 RepID=UPI0037BE829B
MKYRPSLLLALLLVSLSAPPLRAEEGATEAPPPALQLDFPDVELVDASGRSLRYYPELIADRIVAVQFIFTRCKFVCPLLGSHFRRVQELIGEPIGGPVRLLSISVDPLNDSPERLQAWAQQHRAGPGWSQLTGGRSEIDTVLKALGAYAADREDHTSFVLVGDARSGDWRRMDGMSAPQSIADEISRLLAAR